MFILCICVSSALVPPYKQVHLHHVSRFRMYELVWCICLFLIYFTLCGRLQVRRICESVFVLLICWFASYFRFHMWVLSWHLSSLSDLLSMIIPRSHPCCCKWHYFTSIVLWWTLRCMDPLEPSFSPDICPGVGLLNRTATLFLAFWGTSILFCRVAAPVCIPTNSIRGWEEPCLDSLPSRWLPALWRVSGFVAAWSSLRVQSQRPLSSLSLPSALHEDLGHSVQGLPWSSVTLS